MRLKCVGPVYGPSNEELRDVDYYQGLAQFCMEQVRDKENPFDWVNDAFERFFACRKDCDACGKCEICQVCTCNLFDADGNVFEIEDFEYDDVFGLDPKRTMTRLRKTALHGQQNHVQGPLKMRITILSWAREIVQRS